MKLNPLHISLTGIVVICFSCAAERKSEKYYQDNKSDLVALKSYYDALYKNQPFSAGFTDKSCRYYVMQINTDTLRTVYTTDTRKEELWKNVLRYQYDTVLLSKMAQTMKKLKCLWLGKTTDWLGEQKETYTFISFGSALVDKPFVEDKYYILIFLDRKIDHPVVAGKIKKGELVRVDDLVYFTIGSSYR
ncbi:MAG TPA: hypothetical protein VFO37_00980 [Chitinophagaceae bacterium]|nr:hypothetical protein [Chitinophagaceae bacterium]